MYEALVQKTQRSPAGVYMCVRMSVSVGELACVSMFECLFLCLFAACLSIYLSIYLSIRVSVSLNNIHPSIRVSVSFHPNVIHYGETTIANLGGK